MKRILSFVLVALIGITSAHACIRKKALPEDRELVGFVMDTTQALLPDATIQIGKTTLRTSWDGRFVLTPIMLAQGNKINVSCDGYESKTLTLKEAAQPLLIALTPKFSKTKPNHHPELATRRGDVMYKSLSASEPAVFMTGMVVEEAAEATVDAYDSKVEKTVKPRPTGTANNVTAGKLTAGEVNDFAKWYFWPSVLDNSHQKYISDWRLTPRHRYTVQVTNKNGYPVATRAVSLLDANNNTLFQAVTDNTGKAELWYQLIGNNLCGKHAGLRLRVDDTIIDAKEWSEGLNTFVLDEECAHSDAVDVVFVFDATGSMGDELRYLQAEMKDVISRAKEATGGLNIRTGAVVYRDHSDEYVTRISRLTEDITTTQTFIDKQTANGGGDYPEAVPEALMAAFNSAGWDSEARARTAFLVLDAPCHQDSTTVALLHEQVLNAAALGIRIVPVVCSGLGESGELLLRTMALATNGTSFFLTDDSGIGHSHLKPTTDSLKVEHLNDMLVRTIVEFSLMPNCAGHWDETVNQDEIETFVQNPFDVKDLTEEERIAKDSRTTLYLLDISGKLIHVYQGRLEEAGDSQLSGLPIPMLSTGVYFVKAFYDGQWHTKKILVH